MTAMKPDLRDSKDFLAGLLFLTIGLAAILVARDYPFGTGLVLAAMIAPAVRRKK